MERKRHNEFAPRPPSMISDVPVESPLTEERKAEIARAVKAWSSCDGDE